MELTREIAANIVRKLEGDEKVILFMHFDDHFGISKKDNSDGDLISVFAIECGFATATSARPLVQWDRT